MENLNAAAATDLADGALITKAFDTNIENDDLYEYSNGGAKSSNPRFGYDLEGVPGQGPEDDWTPLDKSYGDDTDQFRNDGGDLGGEYQQDPYTYDTAAHGDTPFDPYALYSGDWHQDPVRPDGNGIDQQGPYTLDDEGQQALDPDFPGYGDVNGLNDSLQNSYASDQVGYGGGGGRGGVQQDPLSAEQLDYDVDSGDPEVSQDPNLFEEPDLQLHDGMVHQPPYSAAQPDLPVYGFGAANLPLSFDPFVGNSPDQEPHVANNGSHDGFTISNQPDGLQSGRNDEPYSYASDQLQSEDNANPSPYFPDGNVNHGNPYSAGQPVYHGVDPYSINSGHGGDGGGETGSLQQDVAATQCVDFQEPDASQGSGQNQAPNLGPDDSYLGEFDSATETGPAASGGLDQYQDPDQDSWGSVGPEPGPDPVQGSWNPELPDSSQGFQQLPVGSEVGQDGWNALQLLGPDQGYDDGQGGWDQQGNGDTWNQGSDGSGGSALRPPYSADQSSDLGDNLGTTSVIENVIDGLQQQIASSTSVSEHPFS
jgi:hypothetical protein